MTWKSTGHRIWRRAFSSTPRRAEIQDIEALNDRIIPRYQSLCLLGYWWNVSNGYRISNQRSALFAMAITASKHPHDQEGSRPRGHRLPDGIREVRISIADILKTLLILSGIYIPTMKMYPSYSSRELLHRYTNHSASRYTPRQLLVHYPGK